MFKKSWISINLKQNQSIIIVLSRSKKYYYLFLTLGSCPLDGTNWCFKTIDLYRMITYKCTKRMPLRNSLMTIEYAGVQISFLPLYIWNILLVGIFLSWSQNFGHSVYLHKHFIKFTELPHWWARLNIFTLDNICRNWSLTMQWVSVISCNGTSN